MFLLTPTIFLMPPKAQAMSFECLVLGKNLKDAQLAVAVEELMKLLLDKPTDPRLPNALDNLISLSMTSPNNRALLNAYPDLVFVIEQLILMDDDIFNDLDDDFEVFEKLNLLVLLIAQANPTDVAVRSEIKALMAVYTTSIHPEHRLMARRSLKGLSTMKLSAGERNGFKDELLSYIQELSSDSQYSSDNDREIEALADLMKIFNVDSNKVEKLGHIGKKLFRVIAQSASERRARFEELAANCTNDHQLQTLDWIFRANGAKRDAFSHFDRLPRELDNFQSWVSVNSPDLAKKIHSVLESNHKGKYSKFINNFATLTGQERSSIEISEVDFKIYPDEIIDSVLLLEGSVPSDPAMIALLDQTFDREFKIRYFARTISDMFLGKTCGDCTAPGGVNFGNSLTWFSNPLYQIVTVSQRGRLLFKFGLTPAKVYGERVILVDTLEFHPQTKEGLPYHDLALEGLDTMFKFLKRLSKLQNRQVEFLVNSNSSAVWGEFEKLRLITPGYREPAVFYVEYPISTVKNIIGLTGNHHPFYQSFTRIPDISRDYDAQTSFTLAMPADSELARMHD